MHLFDTARGRVERFRPVRGQPVRVYACGITPYDTTHVGHAFTYIIFDVLVRHLTTTFGWDVRYVQNVTDIDDDIVRRAAELGTDWRSLGDTWTARFTADMAALNMRPPDRFAGATAYIAPMQGDIAALLDAGLAYARGGGVYFAVDRDAGFGALSGLDRAAMLETANARGNVPGDPNKRNPLDFVLWQAAQPGEPAWHSPWGPGRPGWHIECSTLARALLGDRVDVHGGGADLVFPHHACEIAESEPLVGSSPWVRFWLHVAMVRMNGEKMSKSLGNLVMVRDLLEAHHPDTIRLYLLRHHYRTAWEWDPERFATTEAWTRTLHAARARASGARSPLDPGTYGPRLTAALSNDLDTPGAVAVALDLADAILEAPLGADVRAAQDVLSTIAGRLLGLWLGPTPELSTPAAPAWPAPETAPPDVPAFGAS